MPGGPRKRGGPSHGQRGKGPAVVKQHRGEGSTTPSRAISRGGRGEKKTLSSQEDGGGLDHAFQPAWQAGRTTRWEENEVLEITNQQCHCPGQKKK